MAVTVPVKKPFVGSFPDRAIAMAGWAEASKAVPSLFETATFPAVSSASTMYWTCPLAGGNALAVQVWPFDDDRLTTCQVPGAEASVYRMRTWRTGATDGVTWTWKLSVAAGSDAWVESIVGGVKSSA